MSMNRYLKTFKIVNLITILWGILDIVMSQSFTPTPPPNSFKNKIILNSYYFYPNSSFLLKIALKNESKIQAFAQLFVVFEYGSSYFFYPSFGTQLDYIIVDMYPHTKYFKKILEFIWPNLTSNLSLTIYSILTEKGNINNIYDMDTKKIYYFTTFVTATPTPYHSPTSTPLPTKIPLTPTPTPQPEWKKIPGNQLWTYTGIVVNSTDTITINARGTICFHRADCEGTTVGPNGFDGDCSFDTECQNQPFNPPNVHGCLIGKIGENGTPFFVGEIFSTIAGLNGKLYLGINDGNVSDNEGYFEAKISITK